MKFFFPDSHDLVDPSFDFETEKRSVSRLRQRDDLYAHEILNVAPYSGLLVSKAIVDGTEKGAGKYTISQRLRLLRSGVRDFFRLEESSLLTMGDCGAFSYVKEKIPPYTVDEVIEFYLSCDFDYGVSVDHVILGYQSGATLKKIDESTLSEFRERQQITLDLAAQFLKRHRADALDFIPLGVAQGWSPASYADSVSKLQKMGYDYIGIGGLVPLKTEDIIDVMSSVNTIHDGKAKFHLFGVSRCEHLDELTKFNVESFDSTSPLLQAFKHDKENYYTPDYKFSAVRVPQTEGNAKLSASIRAGKVNQEDARKLEIQCLTSLQKYDKTGTGLSEILELLREYDLIFDGRKDRTKDYRKTLESMPWKKCECSICKDIGINVIIFRGAERNRRRGFHNLYVIHKSIEHHL